MKGRRKFQVQELREKVFEWDASLFTGFSLSACGSLLRHQRAILGQQRQLAEWRSVCTTVVGNLLSFRIYSHPIVSFDEKNSTIETLAVEGSSQFDAHFLFFRSLSLNHLSGTIPSSIGNLKDLNTLFVFSSNDNIIFSRIFICGFHVYRDMGVNLLNGTIPSTVGNLVNLEEMYGTEKRITFQRIVCIFLF